MSNYRCRRCLELVVQVPYNPTRFTHSIASLTTVVHVPTGVISVNTAWSLVPYAKWTAITLCNYTPEALDARAVFLSGEDVE